MVNNVGVYAQEKKVEMHILIIFVDVWSIEVWKVLIIKYLRDSMW